MIEEFELSTAEEISDLKISAEKNPPEISAEKISDDGIFLAAVDIGRAYGVHARTVATWFVDGLQKPPVAKSVVAAWLDGRRGGAKGKLAAPPDPELESAKKRESIAKADLAQTKAQRAAGKLIAVAEIEEIILPYLTSCCQLLDQVPDKLLSLNGANPRDFLEGARRMIDDARSQISAAAKSLLPKDRE